MDLLFRISCDSAPRLLLPTNHTHLALPGPTPPALTHLVRDLPLRALRGIPLVLVDERLHHPLLAERREARRLVVQLVHELLGPVRLQL